MSIMIVAISGTPGTGKSSVAPLVAEELGYDVVDLNAFTEEHGLQTEQDVKRESMMVDVEELNEVLEDELGDDVVLDGHLAHHCKDADITIVLRTEPDELKSRLSDRDWDDEKVEENVMAERIDVILQEAANTHPDTTFEIDTSERDPQEAAKEIVYLIENPDTRSMYTAGGTDWEMAEGF